MADLTTLQAHRVALETARGMGEKRVTFNGRTVEYRTGEEISQAIREVDREIGLVTNITKTKRRYSLAGFRRG